MTSYDFVMPGVERHEVATALAECEGNADTAVMHLAHKHLFGRTECGGTRGRKVVEYSRKAIAVYLEQEKS